MKKETSAVIVTKTQNWIDKCLESAVLRHKDTAFMRTKKLGAKRNTVPYSAPRLYFASA
jgi:hypothetical protein